MLRLICQELESVARATRAQEVLREKPKDKVEHVANRLGEQVRVHVAAVLGLAHIGMNKHYYIERLQHTTCSCEDFSKHEHIYPGVEWRVANFRRRIRRRLIGREREVDGRNLCH